MCVVASMITKNSIQIHRQFVAGDIHICTIVHSAPAHHPYQIGDAVHHGAPTKSCLTKRNAHLFAQWATLLRNAFANLEMREQIHIFCL